MPETVKSYSQRAAEAFIQTAVFVDDRLYQGRSQTSGQARKVAAPKVRKRAIKSAEKAIEQNAVLLPDEGDTTPDAYDIVNSFAKKQIVCSLYQPKRDASVSNRSDVFPLCRAADIVIVDWDLYGDRGKRAIQLINGLVAQAVHDVPEQLRLILVYTQEFNLFSIADQLYQDISQSIEGEFAPQTEDGGLAFHTANSRVVVLGKPGRTRTNVDEKFVVDETDLADVAVREFSRLASGLLHAASLLGLAKIRENSRKILSKFNRELDSAFLTHHALSLPEEDASTHIIPLLVSEIEAVLEDALERPLMPKNLLKDWCNRAWEPGDHVSEFLNDGQDAKVMGESVLLKGFEETRKAGYNKLPKISNNANIRKAASLFSSSKDDRSDHKLSHLMTSRTFYGRVPRVLILGTVVFQRYEERYLLCLQPVCDSVRLEAERGFLFVELKQDEGVGKGKATHVVVRSNSEILELVFQPKSFSCSVIKFKPTLGRKQVVGKDGEDSAIIFQDTAGNEYEWIDQLKPAFAQRAVSMLASDLSRVGLTESEWLRGLGNK